MIQMPEIWQFYSKIYCINSWLCIAEIEFTMPLKSKRQSFDNNDTVSDTQDSMSQQFSEDSNLADVTQVEDDDDPASEEWLQSMGVNADDIKRINYTQVKIYNFLSETYLQTTLIFSWTELNFFIARYIHKNHNEDKNKQYFSKLINRNADFHFFMLL